MTGPGGTLELFAPEDRTVEEATGESVEPNCTPAGRQSEAHASEPGASQHRGTAEDVAAVVRGRTNKRAAILAYFAQRQGWRISSAELHGEFGSAFRTRVSEINRDPALPIRILNQTTAGPDGEKSYYFAVPRKAEGSGAVAGHVEGFNSSAAGAHKVAAAGGAAHHTVAEGESGKPRPVQPSPGAGTLAASRSRGRADASAKFPARSGAGGGFAGAGEVGGAEESAQRPVWTRPAAECSPACACFHHSFCGPGGTPCIACP